MIHEWNIYRTVINVTFCWTFCAIFYFWEPNRRRIDPLIKNRGSFLPPQLCFKITASVAGVDTRIISLKLGMTREISLNWGSRGRRQEWRGKGGPFPLCTDKVLRHPFCVESEHWTMDPSLPGRITHSLWRSQKARTHLVPIKQRDLGTPRTHCVFLFNVREKTLEKVRTHFVFVLSTLNKQEFLYYQKLKFNFVLVYYFIIILI